MGITNHAIFQCIEERSIEIGNSCGFISPVFSSRWNITVGDNVKMGANVRIYDHDYHSLNHFFRRNPETDGKTANQNQYILEMMFLLGTNATILKGVSIGDRSIIGASSVVSIKNIPPDSIVAGNSAQIIKSN